MLGFFRNLSPVELALIIIVLMLFFGRKIVIRLARNSGETLREFKHIKKDFDEGMKVDSSSS